MSTTRSRQKQDEQEAYDIQAKAGIHGALRGLAVGVGLAITGHHTYPPFRRQTLSFKAFLVSGFTIFGLVFGAESALIEHEAIRRREENFIRREARLDLARRGLIGTETEIAKWRAAKEQEYANSSSS